MNTHSPNDYIDNRMLEQTVVNTMRNTSRWYTVRTLSNVVQKQLVYEVPPRKLAMRITMVLGKLIANEKVIRLPKGQVFIYKWRWLDDPKKYTK